MKISNGTIKILNNFSTINNGLVVQTGSFIKTISDTKAILAEATIPEFFEKDFALSNLRKFLASLSMFNDPDVDLHEKFLIIHSGKQSLKFFYTLPELITQPPKHSINLPSVDVSFDLSEENIKYILKAGSLLNSDVITISPDVDNSLNIKIHNNSNITSDSSNIIITEAEFTKTVDTLFSLENLKIIPDSYHVKISNHGMIVFTSKNFDLTYYIALKMMVSNA